MGYILRREETVHRIKSKQNKAQKSKSKCHNSGYHVCPQRKWHNAKQKYITKTKMKQNKTTEIFSIYHIQQIT